MPQPNVDAQYLARLRDHYARYGAIPSYALMSHVVGFGKTAAVKLAQRLTAAGYLRPAPGGKLVPADKFFELPLVDVPVRAGAPEAIHTQEAAELITLDSFLIDSPSTSVLVRVKGFSMRDAGILDGDLAVVNRTDTARAGQFVVAIIDGEFTLKELRYEGKQPVLHPHNPEHAILRPKGALDIFGVVRGIVRRYQPPAASRQRKSGGGNP